MLPFLTESFGNPSSAHAFGRVARAALDDAHERFAASLGVEPREVVFTSGGTEANNLALKGAAWAGKARGHRIVTSSIEHHAVGHTLRYLEKFGFEIVELPVDRYGRVDPDAARGGAHRPDDPRLDHARQQRGRHDPADRRDRRSGCAVAQGRPAPRRRRAGGAVRRPATLAELGADLVSISGHKFEGPKGIGALYVRHGTHILAQQHGGEQERHRRAGTENVAGRRRASPTAYELSVAERPATVKRLRSGARATARRPCWPSPRRELTGHPTERLPGLLSIIARGTDGAAVSLSLDLEGIATSVGSACTTGSTEVSHVLSAMGYPEDEARGALRLSLGRTNTDEEIATAVEVVPRVVASMQVGSASRGARPARPGGRRVSRILVAMSGGVDSSVAAAILHERGPRGRRRLDAPPRRGRHVLRVQEELLLARRGRRRPARGRPARHPVLRHEPRARVRRRRPPAVPRRLPRRSDAEPVRRLQHVREVRGAARAGAPPVRVRGRRDRPLRAAAGRRRRSRAAAPRARRGQGPDLLPVRPAAGPARARPVPARRADQARGARASRGRSAW